MRLSRWARLSIAAKLPLSLAVLLSVGFSGMTAAVYLMMRASVLDVASERLDRAAHQMSETLGGSVRQRMGLLLGLASRVHAVAVVDQPSEAVIQGLLQSYAGSNATMSVEWWNADANRLVVAGAVLPELPPSEATAITTLLDESQGPVALPYRREPDVVSYGIGMSIRGVDRTIGYLVERRRVPALTGPLIGLLTGLIGTNARLLIGNASGDLWLDLGTATVLTMPAGADRTLVTYASPRGGDLLLARAAPIADTPWHVGVALPRAPVLAPAQQFLITAIALSCLLIAFGAGAGWLVTRRITTPLRLVTDAAESLAVGKSSARIPVTRSDEVGRLATSFNAMAAEVELSRHRLEMLVADLERRVRARTSALEASNRELEAFSYSVSHDLRAPLRAIDGFTRVFVEEYGESLPPDSMQYLQVIVQRTHHMGQLIDGLLSFSRLARQPVTRAPLDMTALAQVAAEDVRVADGEDAAEIVVEPLPPTQGEPVLVQQVIANLLENAVKFSRSRPSPRIEMGSLVKDGETVYYVRDNGVGFDMQYAGKLFGVFQRLHRADEFEGTGVGLALVRRIVERHGGRVWAESVLDQGATFYFTLPPGAPILVPPSSAHRTADQQETTCI